jgi:hypothetical protein
VLGTMMEQLNSMVATLQTINDEQQSLTYCAHEIDERENTTVVAAVHTTTHANLRRCAIRAGHACRCHRHQGRA